LQKINATLFVMDGKDDAGMLLFYGAGVKVHPVWVVFNMKEQKSGVGFGVALALENGYFS
jgi:hypothetical protein